MQTKIKKAEVAMPIPNKMYFETKNVKRDKKGHYIMTKWSIEVEDIKEANVYSCNVRAPKYIANINKHKGKN